MARDGKEEIKGAASGGVKGSRSQKDMPEQEALEQGAPGQDAIQEEMIQEILSHLDNELQKEVVRMSVTMDDGAKEKKVVSHKCCNSYGRPANETVGLLDMYTDRNAGKPDRDNG